MNKPGRASSHLCSSYSLCCFLGSLLLSSMNLTISRSPLSLLSSPPTITTWTLNKTDNMDNTRRNKTNNINLIEEVIYLVGNRPAVLRLNLLQPSVTAEDEDMGEREVTFHHKPPENLSPKWTPPCSLRSPVMAQVLSPLLLLLLLLPPGVGSVWHALHPDVVFIFFCGRG